MSLRTTGGLYNRRKGAFARLEAQLKEGDKPLKNTGTATKKEDYQPLTDGDKKRINKELETLKKYL